VRTAEFAPIFRGSADDNPARTKSDRDRKSELPLSPGFRFDRTNAGIPGYPEVIADPNERTARVNRNAGVRGIER
jgi:hypothetical protein